LSRVKGGILFELFYIASVLPPQWSVIKGSSYNPVEPRVSMFLGCMIYLYFCVFCFTLNSLVISLQVFALVLQLKRAPLEFFAPSPLLPLRSWLHPFKHHC